jgi:mono/diheme cytochrome c family protein
VNLIKTQRILLILAVCAGASVLVACFGDSAREDKAGFDPNGPLGATAGVEPHMPGDVRAIFNRSCNSCHGPDGRGIAAVAPDLHRSKSRSAEEWEKYLRDSRDAHPKGYPPPLWLTADEMKWMADYLESLARRSR